MGDCATYWLPLAMLGVLAVACIPLYALMVFIFWDSRRAHREAMAPIVMRQRGREVDVIRQPPSDDPEAMGSDVHFPRDFDLTLGDEDRSRAWAEDEDGRTR